MIRNCCWDLLQSIECRHLAIDKQDIITVHANDSVLNVVKVLHSKKVLLAPVLNENDSTVVGAIDLLQLISWLIKNTPLSESCSVEADAMRLQTAQQVLRLFTRENYARLDPHDKCLRAIELFAKSRVRCVLIDEQNYLDGLLTQSELAIELVAAMISGTASMKALGQRTLEQMNVGFLEPISIFGTQSIVEALALFENNRISALPVVDGDGILVASFSTTDLAPLWIDEAGVVATLNRSVTDFLNKFSPWSLHAMTARRNESLVAILSRMIDAKVHHFWITDVNGRPCGVFSLTDLFKIVYHHREPVMRGTNTRVVCERFCYSFRSVDADKQLLGICGDNVVKLDVGNEKTTLWNVMHVASDASCITLESTVDGKFLTVDENHQIRLHRKQSIHSYFRLQQSESGCVALVDYSGGFITWFKMRAIIRHHDVLQSECLGRLVTRDNACYLHMATHSTATCENCGRLLCALCVAPPLTNSTWFFGASIVRTCCFRCFDAERHRLETSHHYSLLLLACSVTVVVAIVGVTFIVRKLYKKNVEN